MNLAASLRQSLADELARGGQLTDPAWRAAVEAVPREVFLGDAVFRPNGAQWEPAHRDQTADERWLQQTYANTTWVTQVDGISAHDAAGPVTGRPTSSGTLPSLVLRMLELADIREGQRVLEIGTGTGYSTAILCHRLGDEAVYSVEYDQHLAATAAQKLHDAGYFPRLVTADGLRGYQDGAEYDTIIATCSVRTIPPSWLWQLRDAGSVVTTISGWMLASGLIRLVLDEDGAAHGRFAGDHVSYMLARPHERPHRPTFYPHPGTVRTTGVNPDLLDDWTGRFIAQLAAPSAELVRTAGGIALLDVATGSQAWTEPYGNSWNVHQDGPLQLWDQVESALYLWQKEGAPDQTALGMTVTEWDQTVWLGDPTGPSWQLPT